MVCIRWYSKCVEETKRRRGRPATGVTPKRNLRVGPIWDEAAAIAAERGDGNMTQLVTRLLTEYVQRQSTS